MNNNSFVRKIIYIIIIGALLIPLSMVSRPATRGGSGGGSAGGKLAQLRDEYDLSQAKMMEIDPASETMKLATLGLRGVAVNLLWMQAIEHKRKENWDQLASTLQALIKVQPNFVKVWEFQAHNLSYNISMEFDDYEYRYHWVKKGINFLKDGIPYNLRDHRMSDNLGFFTGMKIGRSDEKDSFRRMFRQDEQFHDVMSEYIEPDTYDTREYGADNWKMAWMWYDRSQKMIEAGAPKYNGDALFYAKRPAQLRNQAGSLQNEFRSDEIIQEIWREAHQEWLEYGSRQIVNTRGIMVTMEGMIGYTTRIEQLRAELDALAPEGTRDALESEVINQLKFTPEEQLILDTPPDQRTDEEAAQAAVLMGRMFNHDTSIDLKVMFAIEDDANRLPGKRIVEKIADLHGQMASIAQQDGITNYAYWRSRTATEANELSVNARRIMYDAKEMARRSIFDDEYVFNYKTKEKKIVQKGAISLYEESFEAWRRVLEEYPDMVYGDLSDRIVENVQDYKDLLDIAGIEWKNDFPLQALIDQRALEGEMDGLMTSEMLEERRLDREEELEDELDSDDNETVEEKPTEEAVDSDDN